MVTRGSSYVSLNTQYVIRSTVLANQLTMQHDEVHGYVYRNFALLPDPDGAFHRHEPQPTRRPV